MTTYLVIDNVDWTPYIDVRTYAINQKAEVKEWQDGNGRYHQDFIRGRISGSFKIGFKDAATMADWENAVAIGGYHHATVYVNNLSSTVETDVFIETTAQTTRDEVNGRIWTAYTVNLEEC